MWTTGLSVSLVTGVRCVLCSRAGRRHRQEVGDLALGMTDLLRGSGKAAGMRGFSQTMAH